jgi:hypothetical protein
MLISRSRQVATLFIIAACLSCSGASGDPSAPTDHPTPTRSVAVIALSSDSVITAVTAGAAPISDHVQIFAGNSVSLSGLSVGGPQYASAAGWLATTLSATAAPAELGFTIDPRQLAAGTYTATVAVTATNATPVSIRVRVDVRTQPVLRVSPDSAAIDATNADSIASAMFAVSSSGESIGDLVASVDCDSALATRAAIALSEMATPASAVLRVDVNGAPSGSYRCAARISSRQALVDSASRSATLTVRIRDLPLIAVAPKAAALTVAQGAVGSATTIAVANGGTGTLDGLAVDAVTYDGSATGWISEASLAGTTAPTTMRIGVNAASLTPGTYDAAVSITSTSGAPSATVPVTLTVTQPPPPPLRLIVQPSSISTTCHVNTTVNAGTYSVSMSDGSSATLGAGTGITSSSGLNLVAFSWGGAISTSQVPSSVSVVAACGKTPGVASYVFTLKTTSGYSATMSMTVTVVP